MASKLMEDLDKLVETAERLQIENGLLRKANEKCRGMGNQNVSRLAQIEAIVKRLEQGTINLSEFHAEVIEYKDWSNNLYVY